MRHGCFVGSGIINELLVEVFQLSDHGFWLIGDRRNDNQNGFDDFGDNSFKRFSGVNYSFGSVRDSSVSGDINKDDSWILI